MNISFRLTAILCILAVGFMTMGLLVPTVDADPYAIVVHSYTVYLCSTCAVVLSSGESITGLWVTPVIIPVVSTIRLSWNMIPTAMFTNKRSKNV